MILIVDDDPRDREITRRAVRLALTVSSRSEVDVQVACNKDQAAEILNKGGVTLLITDLMMRSLENQSDRCKEMEFPQGLRLLQENPRKEERRIVNTLYWNYPGFARYNDVITQCADGAIPKDIFYAVGTITELDSEDLKRYAEFTPLRNLILALDLLLTKPASPHIQLYMRSLYEEASAYLRAAPHWASDIRRGVALSHTDGLRPMSQQDRPKKEEWSPEEVSQQLAAAHWLPVFAVHTPAIDLTVHKISQVGLYKKLMESIREDMHWKVAVSTSQRAPRKYGDSVLNGTADGDQITYQLQCPTHITIAPCLTPNRHIEGRPGGDRSLAELLLTLGFFTNWCHLKNYQLVLTASEIAEIIERETGVPYGKVEKFQNNSKKAAEQIKNDLHILDRVVTQTIMENRHNEWYRHLGKTPIIGHFRSGGSRDDQNYRYWLNASIRLYDRRKWNDEI